MAGGRGKRVPDDEILAVFRATDAPVLSTREVADDVGLARRSTLSRLEELSENGQLKKKKIDGRRTVWWDPELLQERYSQQE